MFLLTAAYRADVAADDCCLGLDARRHTRVGWRGRRGLGR